MAHPFNTGTVQADHGTSYKKPLLYRQIMAHPINTATV